MEKYSKQREEILNLLKNSCSHPTADEIYLDLKKMNSTASKGTVYRNLDFLCKKDLIKQISVESGPNRYDYMHKPHHHIVCKKCGKVYDFDFDIDILSLKSAILEQTKSEMCGNDVSVQGICKTCKEQ